MVVCLHMQVIVVIVSHNRQFQSRSILDKILDYCAVHLVMDVSPDMLNHSYVRIYMYHDACLPLP